MEHAHRASCMPTSASHNATRPGLASQRSALVPRARTDRNEEAKIATALMGRYASGDDAAFHELYRLLSPRLYRYCVSLCGVNDAEDLLQEVFLKMHRARTRFVDTGGVFAWAFTIARTTHLDRVRYQQRRRELVLEQQQLEQHPSNETTRPDELSLQHALETELVSELNKLTDTLRTAYVLVKIEGLSSAEAASELGISADAVKQRVHRAALSLKVNLGALAQAA